MTNQLIGIGNADFSIAVYIANRPPLLQYETLETMYYLISGEVYAIAQQTGNHWRKIFNVYAKFLHGLGYEEGHSEKYDTWQQYRDNALLQAGCQEALLFTPPSFNSPLESKAPKHKKVHIIAGKTYAAELNLPCSLHWQDAHFAINKDYNLIVSPYLDYRQLSNERIERLVEYVRIMLA